MINCKSQDIYEFRVFCKVVLRRILHYARIFLDIVTISESFGLKIVKASVFLHCLSLFNYVKCCFMNISFNFNVFRKNF